MIEHTEQQKAIIEEQRSGRSLAVQALAGTGKTSTIEAALRAQDRPGLYLVFNRKNADEAKERLPPSVQVKTLNGLGHAAWARHIGRRPQISTKKLSTLLSESSLFKDFSFEDRLDVVKLARVARQHGLSSGFNLPPPDRDLWRDLAIKEDVDSPEDLFPAASWLFSESCKQAFLGNCDYDDQIYMPIAYNSKFERHPIVAVDEAQDLNHFNHLMIERSLAKDGQITIVGDPFQAIYAFRGAKDNSFDLLVDRFRLPILPLSKSFRCPRAVIREAQKIVPAIEAFSSREGEVQRVRADPIPAVGSTVLARFNAPLVRLAFRSIRKRVPVYYTGRDFMGGLRALHRKCPSIPLLDVWLKHMLAEAKTPGAKARAQDRYDSLIALHDEAKWTSISVEDALAELCDPSTTRSFFTLSTIHKAKGLEWPLVTYLDYTNEIHGLQESNIKYVGITRSKDRLILQGDY